MVTETREVEIRIRHLVSGLDELQKSIARQRELGGDTRELQDAFDTLERELDSIANQQKLIDSFEAVSQALEHARTETQRLEQEQELLRPALERTNAAEREAAQRHEEAARALGEASDRSNRYAIQTTELRREQQQIKNALAEAKDRLRELNAEYRDADQPTDELTQALAEQRAEVSRLEAAQRDLKQEIADQRVENSKATVAKREAKDVERELSRELKDTEKAASAQRKEFEKLAGAQNTASREAGDLEGEVRSLQARLAATGVDTSNLAAAEQVLARRSIEASQSLRRLQDEVEDTGSRVSGLRDRMNTLAVALGNVIATGFTRTLDAAKDGIFSLARRMLTLGGNLEDARTQFTRLEGSVEAGNVALEKLRRLSAETGTQFDKNREIYVALRNFGIDPLNGSLQAIIDQTAALGKGQEVSERIAIALGQAYAKQKLQAEEMLQLTEAGVPVFDLLTEATGKSAAELNELARRGELGRDAIDALIEAMGRAAEGAAAAGLKNLNGLLRQARQRIDDFLTRVADSGPIVALKNALADFNATLKDTDRLAEDTGAAIVNTFAVLQTLAGTVRIAFNGLTGAVRGALLGIVEAARLAAVGLSKVSFGAAAERFEREAEVLSGISASLREQLVGDYEDIGAGANMVVQGVQLAGRVTEDSAEQAATALEKQRKAQAGATDATQKGAEAAREGAAALIDYSGAAEQTAEALNKISDDDLSAEIKRVADELEAQKQKLVELREQYPALSDATFAAVADTVDGFREAEAAVVGAASQVKALREEQLRRLGIDAKELATGVSKDFERVAQAVQNLQGPLNATASELTAASEKLIDSATTTRELEVATELLNAAEQRSLLTGDQLKTLREQLSGRTKELRDSTGEAARNTSGLAGAFQILGVKSSASLKEAAKAAREAFSQIARSGEASAGDVSNAFLEMARRELEAAKAAGAVELAVVSANLKSEAAALGLTDQYGRLADQIAGTGDSAEDAHRRGKKGAEDHRQSVDLLTRSFFEQRRELESNTAALLNQARAVERTSEEYANLYEQIARGNREAGRASFRNADGSIIRQPGDDRSGPSIEFAPVEDLTTDELQDLLNRLAAAPRGFSGNPANEQRARDVSAELDRRREEERQAVLQDLPQRSTRGLFEPAGKSSRTIRLEFALPGGRAAVLDTPETPQAEHFIRELESAGGLG